MKKPYTHLLVACLVLMAMQCRTKTPKPTNPIDQLPPPTQTGENTFGCLVNGEAFVVTNTSQIVAIYQGGVVQLGGGIDNSDFETDITINLEEPLKEQESYNLTNFPIHIAKFSSKTSSSTCIYEFADSYQGSFTFSNIDRTKFIISGTFEFSTVTASCDTVQITDGRFDVQYVP